MEEQQQVLPKTEEELKQSNMTDPDEIAATMFGLYYPKFSQIVQRLSNRACKRLLTNLVGSPLVETKNVGSTEDERNAFAIGDRLLEAKYVMIMNTVAKKFEQALVEQQQTTQPDLNETSVNNVPNGESNNDPS
jgi:hypothetical protein